MQKNRRAKRDDYHADILLETAFMLFLAHRFPRCCAAAVLIALAAGCGVHEYEKKMLDAQSRLQRWEAEEHDLGGPLSVPTRKVDNEEEIIANIFLRAPTNISTQWEPDPRSKLMYYYKEARSGPVHRIDLAVGEHKDFVTDVLRLCPGKVAGPSQTSIRLAGRENPTNFETYEITTEAGDKYIYSVNIWSGSTKVAVVYWILKGQELKGKNLAKLSLQTFAAGMDATEQRQVFLRGSPIAQVPATNP